jgi:hypothetical protein
MSITLRMGVTCLLSSDQRFLKNGWHRWREAVEAFPLQRVFLVGAGGLEARPASTVDTPDRRSSRNHAASSSPGSGGSRTSDTAPPTRASPRSLARLARPTAIGIRWSIERPDVARTLCGVKAHADARKRSACAERPRSPFFRETSFITSISRSRSASNFLSFPFSCSSCRRRFTSTASRAPKRLRYA